MELRCSRKAAVGTYFANICDRDSCQTIWWIWEFEDEFESIRTFEYIYYSLLTNEMNIKVEHAPQEKNPSANIERQIMKFRVTQNN